MRVTELTVTKNRSYEEPANVLVGRVKLEGHFGTQEILLSNGALSKIFGVIANEVQDTARRNADMTKRAMQDAVDEPLMLEAQTIKGEL